MSQYSEARERIVFDRVLGMIFARFGYSSVHGTPEHIEALGAFLLRAAEESRAGLHDAPPPVPAWRLKDIADT